MSIFVAMLFFAPISGLAQTADSIAPVIIAPATRIAAIAGGVVGSAIGLGIAAKTESFLGGLVLTSGLATFGSCVAVSHAGLKCRTSTAIASATLGVAAGLLLAFAAADATAERDFDTASPAAVLIAFSVGQGTITGLFAARKSSRAQPK